MRTCLSISGNFSTGRGFLEPLDGGLPMLLGQFELRLQMADQRLNAVVGGKLRSVLTIFLGPREVARVDSQTS